jgi:RecA-family ATPase
MDAVSRFPNPDEEDAERTGRHRLSSILDRARKYVDSIPGAISGQGGHDQTFTVACSLVNGFALGEHDALRLLTEYNGRCQPPWSEREIAHKIAEALKVAHDKPRGHLIGPIRHRYNEPGYEAHPAVKASSNGKPAPKPAVKSYDLQAAELPKPMADGCRQFLRSVFLPGEGIGIAQEVIKEDKKGIPKGGGVVLSLEEWLKRLDAKGGDPNKIFSSSDKAGAFVRVNPMKLGGSKDSDVTAYRHVLLEFDKISKEEQWSLIRQSNIPCAAVLDSGNKSVHAWVTIGAHDRQEYAQRVTKLYSHFEAYIEKGEDGRDLDRVKSNKNPSRFSRLPGMVRGTKQQVLLALSIGAASFSEWLAGIDVAASTLPAVENCADLLGREIEPPEEIIRGVLHRGLKGTIGGPSKSNKTWLLLDMALSVSVGLPFLKYETVRSRVLYVNLEIPKYFMRERIRKVASAKGISDLSNIDVWNLRGHRLGMNQVVPEIVARALACGAVLIVIDPIYKALNGRKENEAEGINDMCMDLEQIAEQTGAAVVYVAHFSKGNQSQKSAIDRISGSGVWARDADVMLTLTEHEDDWCYVIDFTLRNVPPQASVVIEYKHPAFCSTDKDPTRLRLPNANASKQKAQGKREPTEAEFMSLLPVMDKKKKPIALLVSSEQLRAAFIKHGYHKDTMAGAREACENADLVKTYRGYKGAILVGRPECVDAYTAYLAEHQTPKTKDKKA